MPDPAPRRGPAARPAPSPFKAPSSPRSPAPARPLSQGSQARPAGARPPAAGSAEKAEHEILFQKYFKSVGPRTYASQLKRATNGNHYLILTEGKRDDATGEVRKTRLFVFSEDFVEFFRMLHETAQFIKANPVPEDVKKKRQRFWARKSDNPRPGAATPGRDVRPVPDTRPPNGKAPEPRSRTKSIAPAGVTPGRPSHRNPNGR